MAVLIAIPDGGKAAHGGLVATREGVTLQPYDVASRLALSRDHQGVAGNHGSGGQKCQPDPSGWLHSFHGFGVHREHEAGGHFIVSDRAAFRYLRQHPRGGLV